MKPGGRLRILRVLRDLLPISVPFTPTFKADRPFVYVIRDRETGSVLFLGRVMQPEG